jgi:hypothetical protein
MAAPGVSNRRTIEAWNGADIGRVSNLTWMAVGGIVRRPTAAVVGERGPEAVVPLNRAGALGTTINISYEPHYHGDMAGADIAAYHKQHIDKIARAVEEVVYRRNRSAFSGARAI